VAFVGHSHGATVVLDYLLRREELPACAVAATPWLALRMSVPWWKRAVAAPLARVAPALALHNEIHATDLSRSPEVVTRFDTDPLVLHVATPRWFQEARAAQARLLAARALLSVPTLVLVAGDDQVVSSDATLAWAQAAGPAVSVRSYPALYHEVFREPEREQVIADVREWLRSALLARRDLGRARHDVPGIL
jgi:lysophospholipase